MDVRTDRHEFQSISHRTSSILNLPTRSYTWHQLSTGLQCQYLTSLLMTLVRNKQLQHCIAKRTCKSTAVILYSCMYLTDKNAVVLLQTYIHNSMQHCHSQS